MAYVYSCNKFGDQSNFSKKTGYKFAWLSNKFVNFNQNEVLSN